MKIQIGSMTTLILAIAGFYWGQQQHYYWLWKTCQIILWIYGILIGILIIVLIVVGVYLLVEWLS
jgi:hypothetical protein